MGNSYTPMAPSPRPLYRLHELACRAQYAELKERTRAAKADKDLLQGVTLASILTEQNDAALGDSLRDAPAALRSAARKRLPAI